MGLMKNKTKEMLFKVFKRLAKNPSVNKAIILNYHRVTKKVDNIYDDRLTASEFKEKMCFLKEHFNVVSLPELLARAKNSTIKPLTVAITIDDGYEDGYSVILPILKDLNISAAFFIATEGIDKGCLWNDYISTAFNTTIKERLEHYLDFPIFDLSTLDLKKKAHHIIHKRCKFLSLSERKLAIEQLLLLLDVNVIHDEFLSKNQIKKLHLAGMTIGAHTHQHPILNLESAEISYQEIKHSKELLETIINEDIKYFAYPNGKKNKDFNEVHENMLEDLNFDAALMTNWGHVTPKINFFSVPRFTPWDKDKFSFGIRLCNYFRK